jgi:hypothetical protein
MTLIGSTIPVGAIAKQKKCNENKSLGGFFFLENYMEFLHQQI